VNRTPLPRPALLAAALWLILAPACSPIDPVPIPDGASGRIDPELAVRRIAPGAYVVTHEPAFSSNILLVHMRDGTLVVCSSPLDTEATRTLLRWIRKALAPGRIVAINPHYHPDGTAGNEAYAEAGVETWAAERTQRLLAEHGARVRDESARALGDAGLAARVRATRITPAAHTIAGSDPFTLEFGGEKVVVIQPGPAHSSDNVVVHFPAQGILFGGCMVKAGRSIGNTLDADLGHWEAAARSLQGLDARFVVPGHGAVGGMEMLDNTIEVVRAAAVAEPG
jgi:glyoxylase-like metal-dependent hydrolase (beta-lactamase superfamily II)